MGALSALLQALGGRGDTASATGSANAKLAALLAAPTYENLVRVASDEAISTVDGDTGQLVAGDYEVIGQVFHNKTNGGGYTLQYRNAANNANNRQFFLSGANALAVNGTVRWPRVTVVVNERFRIINVEAGTAGEFVDVYLFVRKVA